MKFAEKGKYYLLIWLNGIFIKIISFSDLYFKYIIAKIEASFLITNRNFSVNNLLIATWLRVFHILISKKKSFRERSLAAVYNQTQFFKIFKNTIAFFFSFPFFNSNKTTFLWVNSY